jgi:hypothetical protein
LPGAGDTQGSELSQCLLRFRIDMSANHTNSIFVKLCKIWMPIPFFTTIVNSGIMTECSQLQNLEVLTKTAKLIGIKVGSDQKLSLNQLQPYKITFRGMTKK